MNSTASISNQSTPPFGDSVLLERFVREQDQDAFGHLVERYEPVVMGAALRRTGDLEMSRDVTQQVFVTLARKAASLVQHPQLGGWLYRTASFLAMRLKRSEKRRLRRESNFVCETSSLSDSAVSPEVWEPLETALAEISTKNRELVVMHYFQDRGYGEMATSLGISEVATRKRMSRALADLGERLRATGSTNNVIKLLAGAVAVQAGFSPSPALAANALATAGATPNFIASSLSIMTAAKTTTSAIPLGILLLLQVGVAIWLLPQRTTATTTNAHDLLSNSSPESASLPDSSTAASPDRQLRMSLPGPGGTRVPRAIAMRTAQRTHALFDGREVYEDLIEALQLTPAEVKKVNAALAVAFTSYEEIESRTVKIIEDTLGLKNWTVPPYPTEGQEIVDSFGIALVDILGGDRAEYAAMSFAHSFYFGDRSKQGVRLSYQPGPDPKLWVSIGNTGSYAMLSRFDKYPAIGSITGATLEREFGHFIGEVEEIRRTLESIKTVP